MKRLTILMLTLILALCVHLAQAETIDTPALVDVLSRQAEIDAAMMAEGETGYPLDAPLVIVDPYGNAPLSAVAIFSTEEAVGGRVTVRGKSSDDDLMGKIEEGHIHYVPLIGLYPGEVTEVAFDMDNGQSAVIEVETEMPRLNYSGFEAEMHKPELYAYNRLNICCLLSSRALAGFDSRGDLRWLYTNTGVDGVRISQNGHILVPSGLQDSSAATGSSALGVDEIDFTGKLYARYVWPGGIHHDFMEMPGGNLLALADSPGKAGSMDYIVEIDRQTGEPVWELYLSDLVRTDDSGAFMNSEADWSHPNGVAYDQDTDTLIVSCRNQDAIFGIEKGSKTLKWLLGDPTGWEDVDSSLFFTPVGEDFEWQYGAHNVTLLENGDLLLFDNGLGGRVKLPDKDKALPDGENYSRAVIYRLDTEHMTARQVWQYGKQFGASRYASIMSGVQKLDTDVDSYLVDFGTCRGEKGMNTFLHYITGDQLVWEMRYQGGPTYRACRVAPYEDVKPYAVEEAGKWYGDLGETAFETVTLAGEPQSAPAEVMIERYPFNALHITGTFMEADPETANYRLILADDEGNGIACPINYLVNETDSGTQVTLNRWVSLKGLELSGRQVLINIHGKTFDTGLQVDE